MTDRNKIEVESLKQFALGGDAILTLENTRDNTHVTLHLRRGKKSGAPIFASVLTGSDNTDRRSYSYVGCVWEKDRNGNPQAPEFRYGGRKAAIAEGDVRVRSVQWLIQVVNGERSVPPHVTIWHEGRCCFCRAELTQPESVKRGYGPVCAGIRALPYGEVSKLAKGVSPLSVECPTCGAEPDALCRRPSKPNRWGQVKAGKVCKVHKARFEAAGSVAPPKPRIKVGASQPPVVEPEPILEPEPVDPAGWPAPTNGVLPSGDTLEERVSDLVAAGWPAEAAKEQALHELKGFTRWLPEMGLPPVAVVDSFGCEWEVEGLDEEDEEDHEDREAA